MSISPFNANAALPKSVDARKLAQREQQLVGVLPHGPLERLAATVEAVGEDIRVELAFGHDLHGHLTVNGKLSCCVQMQCQRCLQPISERVETEFLWGIIWSEEQGKALPRGLDPVMQEGDELSLYQALEDEILLSLPAVAYHAEECVAREYFHCGEEPNTADEQRENPFKVLEQLKGSSNRS